MSRKNLPQIAIAGFGQAGKALCEYFKQTHEVHVFDEVAPQSTSSRQFSKNLTFHQTLTIPGTFSIVYKSPGIPLSKVKLASSKTRITSLTNLFFEKAKGTIIGITGTKGKSTVSSLIYHILKNADKDAKLIGNIGETGLKLLKSDHPKRYYIYELSSYQCELLTASPHIAVITNLYQDHLLHHGSIKKYHQAKAKITTFQKTNDHLFMSAQAQKVFKNLQTKAHKIILSDAPSQIFKTKLLGEHNQLNIAIAYEVATLLKIPNKKILASIASYKPLPGRLEKIATIKMSTTTASFRAKPRSITFYEDALATIPEATWSAIQALPQINTIILGGQDRGIDFEIFAKQLATTDIKNFIIFPDTGKKMVKHLKDRQIFKAKNMEQAIRLAYQYTQGICLLSTASPSFNMFKNYQDRSDQYRYWIKTLSPPRQAR